MPVSLDVVKNIIAELSQKDKETLVEEIRSDSSFPTEANSFKNQIIALALYDSLNKCMTVYECADFLKVSRQTVRSRIDKKEIKVEYSGTKISIPKIQFIDKILEDFVKNTNGIQERIFAQFKLANVAS